MLTSQFGGGSAVLCLFHVLLSIMVVTPFDNCSAAILDTSRPSPKDRFLSSKHERLLPVFPPQARMRRSREALIDTS